MSVEPAIFDVLEKLFMTIGTLFGSVFQMSHTDADLQREADAVLANLPQVRIELRIRPEDNGGRDVAGDAVSDIASDIAVIVHRFGQLGYSVQVKAQENGSRLLVMDGPRLNTTFLQRLLNPGRLVMGAVTDNSDWHREVSPELLEAQEVQWLPIQTEKLVPVNASDDAGAAATDGELMLVAQESAGMVDLYSAFSEAFVASDVAALESLLPQLVPMAKDGLEPFIYCHPHDSHRAGHFCLLQMLSTALVLENGDFSQVTPNANEWGGLYYTITLTEDAGRRFTALSEQNIGREIPMVLDGNVLMMPRVRGRITGNQLQLSGVGNDESSLDDALIEVRIFSALVTAMPLSTPWIIESVDTAN